MARAGVRPCLRPSTHCRRPRCALRQTASRACAARAAVAPERAQGRGPPRRRRRWGGRRCASAWPRWRARRWSACWSAAAAAAWRRSGARCWARRARGWIATTPPPPLAARPLAPSPAARGLLECMRCMLAPRGRTVVTGAPDSPAAGPGMHACSGFPGLPACLLTPRACDAGHRRQAGGAGRLNICVPLCNCTARVPCVRREGRPPT